MRKGRLVKSVAFTLSLLLTMAGCGRASDASTTNFAVAEKNAESSFYNSSSDYAGAAYYDMADSDEYFEESSYEAGKQAETVDDSAANPTAGRKLIRTVHLDIESLEFDRVLTALQDQTAALGGYIENMDMYNGSKYSYYQDKRNASLCIRIPQNKLDTFLDTVTNISNVVNRSESVEDVTLTYADLESHKAVLKAEHTRLLEFMEQAETMEDILAIESRLSEVQYQLESMESQLRTYDNKIDYSTVYLSLQEVEELTPLDEEEQTVWERISEGFTDNLEDVFDGFVDFVVWFVTHIPNLLVFALIVAMIVWIIRLCIRRQKKKKTKQENVYASANVQTDAETDSHGAEVTPGDSGEQDKTL